jgi:hypothetical protein
MCEVGRAGNDINDRYTRVLIEAHLAAAEQTPALVRGSREGGTITVCVHSAFVRCWKRARYAVTGAPKGRILPGQAWWGGWGSNPRPADYEEAGPPRVAAGRWSVYRIAPGQPRCSGTG